MVSSGCREVPVEAAETLRHDPQCFILPHQHVGSVSGRLQRRGVPQSRPHLRYFFFMICCVLAVTRSRILVSSENCLKVIKTYNANGTMLRRSDQLFLTAENDHFEVSKQGRRASEK